MACGWSAGGGSRGPHGAGMSIRVAKNGNVRDGLACRRRDRGGQRSRPVQAGPDAGVDKRERQSCAISERPITSERSAGKKWYEKIGTASERDGEEAEIENEEEGETGERMGRDGKLTRSLLPGALEAENKERRRDR